MERADVAPPAAGWLRGEEFDRFFIIGLAAVAVASGTSVVLEPSLFVPILAIDLWLLGYHHVVSTFTRLCFDARSLSQHRFLIFGLPVLVLTGVATMTFGIGLWTVTTLYLYWQWFHYTRQSWGVAQAYRRTAGELAREGRIESQVVFYLLPLWGILARSAQAPETFLGIELRVVPVPWAVANAVGVLAVASLIWWAASRVRAWRRGQLPVALTLYQASHFTVFAVGYLIIDSLDAGWLVVNVWHNAQYIAFVWHFNNRRFQDRVDPAARFLSTISQQQNLWRYLAVCLAISTVSYAFIGSVVAAVVLPVVMFQAINFHHYIVDGLIWKSRPTAAAPAASGG